MKSNEIDVIVCIIDIIIYIIIFTVNVMFKVQNKKKENGSNNS